MTDTVPGEGHTKGLSEPVAWRWRVIGDNRWSLVDHVPEISDGFRDRCEVQPLFASPADRPSLPLEDLIRPLDNMETAQPGYQHRKGWNDAIMHCMDLQRALAPRGIEVTDEMGRTLVAKYRELWPGAGWPSLEDAKAMISAALTPGKV